MHEWVSTFNRLREDCVIVTNCAENNLVKNSWCSFLAKQDQRLTLQKPCEDFCPEPTARSKSCQEEGPRQACPPTAAETVRSGKEVTQGLLVARCACLCACIRSKMIRPERIGLALQLQGQGTRVNYCILILSAVKARRQVDLVPFGEKQVGNCQCMPFQKVLSCFCFCFYWKADLGPAS